MHVERTVEGTALSHVVRRATDSAVLARRSSERGEEAGERCGGGGGDGYRRASAQAEGPILPPPLRAEGVAGHDRDDDVRDLGGDRSELLVLDSPLALEPKTLAKERRSAAVFRPSARKPTRGCCSAAATLPSARSSQTGSPAPLQSLQGSLTYKMLTLYHAYFIFACVVIGMLIGANLLLSWFTDWFLWVRFYFLGWEEKENRKDEGHAYILVYIGVLVRSWLLIRLLSEGIRTAVWLLFDARRAEAFQLYRCALTGSTFEVMRTGCDNAAEQLAMAGSWKYKEPWRWWLDLAVQAFIYGSFDVLPASMGAYKFMFESPWAALQTFQSWACGAASFHVLIFHAAWIGNDLAAKAIALFWRRENRLFVAARYRDSGRSSNGSGGFADPYVRDSPDHHDGGAAMTQQARSPHPASTDSLVHVDERQGRRSATTDPEAGWQSSPEPREPQRLAELVDLFASIELECFRRSEEDAGQGPSPDRKPTYPGASSGSSVSDSSLHGFANAGVGLDLAADLEESPGLGPETGAPPEESSAEPANFCLLLLYLIQVRFNMPLKGLLSVGMSVYAGLTWAPVSVMILSIILLWVWYEHFRRGVAACGKSLEGLCKCPPPPQERLSVVAWRLAARSTCTRRLQKFSTRMQQWGEEHCGLSVESLAWQYECTCFVMLVQVALLFVAEWSDLLVTTTIVTCLVAARRLTLKILKPVGWILGIGESLACVTCAIMLTTNWNDRLTVVGICLIVQFMLSRHETYKLQIMRGFNLGFHIALVIIVAVSMSAVLVEMQAALNHPGSAALRDSPRPPPKPWGFSALVGGGNRRLLAIREPSIGRSRYAFCDMRFGFGRVDGKGEEGGWRDEGFLNILDFADLCGLTNIREDEKFHRALQWRFPGWRLVFQHRGDVPGSWGQGHTEKLHQSSHHDWSTFFELEPPGNTTTVFAVRGTQGPLDLLQDMNIWFSVGILQLAQYLGPALTPDLSNTVMFFSTMLARESKGYFSVLADHITRRVKADPGRRYYLTGHSLGGGLASMVALKLGRVSVTFSAPGLLTSAGLVISSSSLVRPVDMQNAASKLIYNVVPANDVVPRVDTQIGTQLGISCVGMSMFDCHKLTTITAEIYRGCGHQ